MGFEFEFERLFRFTFSVCLEVEMGTKRSTRSESEACASIFDTTGKGRGGGAEKCGTGAEKNRELSAVNPEDVDIISHHLLSDDDYFELAGLFKHFGDPTRVKLLHALGMCELCVTDLAMILNITPSAVSHQLNALKAAKLVRGRREAQLIYYSLDDDHVRLLLDVGYEHKSER